MTDGNGRLTQKDLLDLFDKRLKPLEDAEFAERLRRERTFFFRWAARILIGAIIVALGSFLVNQLSITGLLQEQLNARDATILRLEATIDEKEENLDERTAALKTMALEVRLLRRFILHEGNEPPSQGGTVTTEASEGSRGPPGPRGKPGPPGPKGGGEEPPPGEEPGVRGCLESGGSVEECLG